MRRKLAFCAALLLLSLSLMAQTPASETITVTATKFPEEISMVPASITIVDREEILARNAFDLASALSATAGVAVAPGGDQGPAGVVPEMWGLREVDAFLLVVDGVPWGGAFNPDTPTVDLTDVDHIEIVRGAAPVMYGTTSFIGVIHVIHRAPGSAGEARASLGSYGSGSAAASVPLSASQSITASYETRGFRDDDTSFDRAHANYRGTRAMHGGTLQFALDGVLLDQQPSTPHLRQGAVLSTRTPLDANYNPAGARLDQNRLQGSLRFDASNYALTLALTHSDAKITRGFLSNISGAIVNATGYDQDRDIDDIYFDAHAMRAFGNVRVTYGVDHLFGRGDADSTVFSYTVPLAGGDASNPTGTAGRSFSETRNFSGIYAATEWTVLPRLRVDAGLRLNHTSQKKGDESRSTTRPSGSLGATFTLTPGLALFADYRNTYKPAATDFSPASSPEILEAEDAQSYEIGAKGTFGRVRWNTSVFQLDFDNMVLPTVRGGLPALENAGAIRTRGAELEIDANVLSALHAALGYSYHDARFGDYAQAFDGVITQLRGRRFEMSPFHMAGASLAWYPSRGLIAHVDANHVGSRFLNKRNTALAPAYTTWGAGLGWRMSRGELRVDGRNLGDERPPVAESELGDAQYYRLPSRTIDVTFRTTF